MRFFVPDIRVAGDLPAQAVPEDKFGGLPWGLAPDLWPKCSHCGKSQSLLAQLLHDSVRLDLGREGRMLYVFQCNHDPGMCSTWEGGSGANACFIVEPERLTNGFSKLPADAPLVENEVRVVGWLERDDGLPSSLKSSFFDDEAFNALSMETMRKVTSSTKLGGVPNWIQSPSEAPQGGWEFVGQLDSTHSFLTAPKSKVSWVGSDSETWEGRTHYGQGPNYGDGGIAYLFLKRVGTVPEGWFFWQCG